MSDTLGIAVVTGASSGIGAVYADRLAQRGYDLVLVARSADKLAEVAGRISAKTGRKIDILPADLGDAADLARVEAFLRETSRARSKIGLVPEPGTSTRSPPPGDRGRPATRADRRG